MQLEEGHTWRSKEKDKSHLDSPISWFDPGDDDGRVDAIPECLIYIPDMLRESAYTAAYCHIPVNYGTLNLSQAYNTSIWWYLLNL